jgi:hypothetical protein
MMLMMLKRSGVLLLPILVLALGMNYRASAQEASPAPSAAATSEGVTSATVLTVHGKVVKVNKVKKLVTLAGADGREVTLQVTNPYNLNSAKVGDPFVARFYEVVTIRKKKPGEEIPSASLSQGIATAKPGAVPGAVAEQHLRLLVTVTAIDEANKTVTVKGPDGATETVKPRDPRNLKRLKVGDELVVGISRAVAITLDKEPGGGAS